MTIRGASRTRVASVVPGVPDPPRRVAILAVLCLSVLIINLDGTVLNVALPRIVATLHVDAAQLQWIVDAYVVVLAGLLLIAGSLGDHLGRKWVFVAGLAIFATGSALSAFSPRAADLIAARAFMGVGAAAIMPSTLSILTNVFTTPHDRARAIGLWSGTNGLGLALGPMIGGWLLAHYWWGSVFLINVPIAALAVVVVLWVVPNSRNPVASRPDVPGAALALAGAAALLWGGQLMMLLCLSSRGLIN
ncbi:MAG: MFS transporter, partial [Acidimicrobiales bacterium]